MGFAFVNPTLRSSSLQFGFGSLDDDVSDLEDLLQYLTSLNPSTTPPPTFVLVGHSTGCQQTVHYLRTSPNAEAITGAILQAPASDRETTEDNAKWCEMAENMINEGKADEFLPRAAFWAPITASRFSSLYTRVADGDDYFSSDLTDSQLSARLSHIPSLISSPTAALKFCIAAYSMNDEYVPPSVDKDALLSRFETIGGLEVWKLAGVHNLMPSSTYPTSHTDFVANVEAKLKTL
ncbi:hypothetical protein TrRE_jg7595 [Triparma retinervis]|uniref:DUF1749-domain-containing protein n=1 Tax=Triparma retinervis TaxID=2557542 RepID=A0A9W7E257_9STRA|nr:hypothetical protein TrRE_jg7595 [Triparma retinervis]